MVNEATIKSMGKMIQAMLPYDYDYKPNSKSGKTIYEIFELLRENNSKLSEFEGFLGYILKVLDNSNEHEKMDIMLMKIWGIINKYYPPDDKPVQDFIGAIRKHG